MNTKVNLAGVELKNPVMVASGTFGSGAEYSEFVDLNRLGAVVTKGVASVPWPGNPAPRIAETASGMLNAIGLQNPGIDLFSKRDLPFLEKYDTKVIVNVCGHSTEEYLDVVERLADEPRVDMLEINISCPNVKEGGIAFGQDPKAVEAITKAVKAKAKQPIIMKLSPNVTDITVMAKAAEAGGADCLSLINTLTGMKIDIERQTFAIANKTAQWLLNCSSSMNVCCIPSGYAYNNLRISQEFLPGYRHFPCQTSDNHPAHRPLPCKYVWPLLLPYKACRYNPDSSQENLQNSHTLHSSGAANSPVPHA